jgi:hypothetical protein
MGVHGAMGTELGFYLRMGSVFSFFAGTCSLAFVKRLTFTRAPVQNVSDPEVFTAPAMAGFIHQSRNNPSLLRFRGLLENVLPSRTNSLQRAIVLRKWVRARQPDSERCWYPRQRETEDPEELLAQQSRGVPGACRRFSYILTGALVSVGLNARVVVFGKSFDQRSERSHTAVEVWCEELEKWVLLDATYDTLIRIDGIPASAFEVYQALKRGDTSGITFDRDGSEKFPAPQIRAYEAVCGHLFIAQTNATFDGYRVRLVGHRRISFAHFVAAGERPYPEGMKRMLFGTAIASFAIYSVLLGLLLYI